LPKGQILFLEGHQGGRPLKRSRSRRTFISQKLNAAVIVKF